MTQTFKQRVEAVLCDATLSDGDKIAQLRQLEADALARERGGTEGVPEGPGDEGEDVRVVERALLTLGQVAAEQGAATL